WQIDGYAPNTSRLMAQLGAAPEFKEMRFLSATTRGALGENNYESFALAFRYAPAPYPARAPDGAGRGARERERSRDRVARTPVRPPLGGPRGSLHGEPRAMAAVRSPHGQHRRLAAGARRAEARARSGRGPSRDRRDASARGLVAARTAAALRRRELGAAKPCRRREPATSRRVQSARDPGAAPVSGRHLWPCGFSLPAGAYGEAARARRVVGVRWVRDGQPLVIF